MIPIDLITGFLGAGKTTFLRKYAQYLVNQGANVGILENDFGAVNVDAMLLQDILGEHCTMEMVAGGCDADCHRRRFKTKLIAMGMCGYDRVLVEPSGIFDMDEFFDALHEDPLERWYQVGTVITIVNARTGHSLSGDSRYLLASQASQAGTIVFSHIQEAEPTAPGDTMRFIDHVLQEMHCQRRPEQRILQKDWALLDDADFAAIQISGYHTADYAKLWTKDTPGYDSLYFMHQVLSREQLQHACSGILKDPACGKVFRIKGFQRLSDGTWLAVNATHHRIQITPADNGQEILIVIGEGLFREAIESYFH